VVSGIRGWHCTAVAGDGGGGILTAIVESYIETGEPVGSGTIAGTIARVQAGGAGLRARGESGDGAERDGGAGERGLAGAAAYVGGAGADGAGVPDVCGAVERRGGNAGAAGLAGSRGRRLESQIDSSFAGSPGRRRCWSGRAMCWRRFRAAWAWRWRGGGRRHAGACAFFAAGAGRVLAVVVTQSGLVRDRVLALDGRDNRI
jgi:heat-inducible transcriptional repressor